MTAPDQQLLLRPDLVASNDDGDGAIVAGARIRLAASRCERDERTEFPARATCPVCGEPMAPVALGCDAVLGGFTAVLHPPPGAEVEVPYLIGVARYPEGVSLLGLLVEVSDGFTGMPIETMVVPVGEERLTYGFRPRAGGQ